jgi:hypothetical protein
VHQLPGNEILHACQPLCELLADDALQGLLPGFCALQRVLEEIRCDGNLLIDGSAKLAGPYNQLLSICILDVLGRIEERALVEGVCMPQLPRQPPRVTLLMHYTT